MRNRMSSGCYWPGGCRRGCWRRSGRSSTPAAWRRLRRHGQGPDRVGGMLLAKRRQTRRTRTMLDRISGFIQQYKGAPVLLGILLVILNFVVVLLSPGTWMASTNLLLHVGVA